MTRMTTAERLTKLETEMSYQTEMLESLKLSVGSQATKTDVEELEQAGTRKEDRSFSVILAIINLIGMVIVGLLTWFHR